MYKLTGRKMLMKKPQEFGCIVKPLTLEIPSRTVIPIPVTL